MGVLVPSGTNPPVWLPVLIAPDGVSVPLLTVVVFPTVVPPGAGSRTGVALGFWIGIGIGVKLPGGGIVGVDGATTIGGGAGVAGADCD